MTFRSFTHCKGALVGTDQTLLQLIISLEQVQFFLPLDYECGCLPVFQFPGSPGTINIATQTLTSNSVAPKILFSCYVLHFRELSTSLPTNTPATARKIWEIY